MSVTETGLLVISSLALALSVTNPQSISRIRKTSEFNFHQILKCLTAVGVAVRVYKTQEEAEEISRGKDSTLN